MELDNRDDEKRDERRERDELLELEIVLIQVQVETESKEIKLKKIFEIKQICKWYYYYL